MSSPADDGDRRIAERAQSTLDVGLDSTVRDPSVPATRPGRPPPVTQPPIADDTHAAGAFESPAEVSVDTRLVLRDYDQEAVRRPVHGRCRGARWPRSCGILGATGCRRKHGPRRDADAGAAPYPKRRWASPIPPHSGARATRMRAGKLGSATNRATEGRNPLAAISTVWWPRATATARAKSSPAEPSA